MSSTRASATMLRSLRARLARAAASRPPPSAPLGLDLATTRHASTTTRSEEARDPTTTTERSGVSSSPLEDDAGSRAKPSSPASSSGESLYPGHVRLTLAQRALLAVTSGLGAVAFPERADLVAAVNETTGRFSLERMRDRMAADSVGSRLLKEKPRITDATLRAARACGPGTLGRGWSRFMGTRKFDPNDRPPARFVDDAELAYVATRCREVHDIWHCLFDCPTTVQGELALKALEFHQTGMPGAGFAALFAPARLPERQRAFLLDELYPWARRAGARCADLLCLDYEAEMHADLEELRLRWRIDTAPRGK